jgi:hypothetical protein
VSSAFEDTVVRALDRIERKCDLMAQNLVDHTAADREQFARLDNTVDLLSTDFHLRKKAAEDAGHRAGATAGKFWGIIGTILAALISGVTAAAR